MELAQVLRIHPECIQNKCIRGANRNINIVIPELLHSRCFSIKKLYLCNNLLQDISWLEFFPHLESLSLSNNRISRAYDLKPLSFLVQLTTLRLTGNPIESIPFYKAKVISYCSRSLESLDGGEISKVDFAQSGNLVQQDTILMKSLRDVFYDVIKLRHILCLCKLHAELFEKVVRYPSIDFSPTLSDSTNADRLMTLWSLTGLGEETLASLLSQTPSAKSCRLIRLQSSRRTMKVAYSTNWEFKAYTEATALLMSQLSVLRFELHQQHEKDLFVSRNRPRIGTHTFARRMAEIEIENCRRFNNDREMVLGELHAKVEFLSNSENRVLKIRDSTQRQSELLLHAIGIPQTL